MLHSRRSEYGDDGGTPATIRIGHLIPSILELQQKLGDAYRIRLGLAYGALYIEEFGADSYHEFTTIGEVVNLAKRLEQLDDVKNIQDHHCLSGAFGVLVHEQDSPPTFETLLEYVAGICSPMQYEIPAKEPPLRGISPSRYALLAPKAAT